jgi:hypothetical protein
MRYLLTFAAWAFKAALWAVPNRTIYNGEYEVCMLSTETHYEIRFYRGDRLVDTWLVVDLSNEHIYNICKFIYPTN